MSRSVRTVAQAGSVAGFGFAAAVATGSLVVAGLDRLGPDAPSSSLDVLRRAIPTGLRGLLVPVESGDVAGLVAPLTSALVTLWAIAWGTRARLGVLAGPRGAVVLGVATALAALCAAGAALAAAPGTDVPVVSSGIAGFGWGVAGALAGTAPPGAALRTRGPVTLLGVAAVLAATWLVALGVVSIVAGSLELGKGAGMFLLAVAYAPNVLAALVALGCGARVEAVVYGYGDRGVALWDWPGGAAPWFVILLVAAPLVATVSAASLARAGDTFRTGLVNGLALGAALVVIGWAGSFEVSGGGPDGDVGMRFGIELGPAFVLGLVWGVAGAYLARVVPVTFARPRVGRS